MSLDETKIGKRASTKKSGRGLPSNGGLRAYDNQDVGAAPALVPFGFKAFLYPSRD